MEKLTALLGSAALVLALTACASGGGTGNAPAPALEVSATAAPVSQNHKILIAYFSYGENQGLSGAVDANASASIRPTEDGVTGNTGLIARDIQKIAGGDLFSIKVADAYSSNYNETVNRGREEQSQGVRPKLSTHVDNLADYDIIFLGYPNWWGDMPMAVYSFLDENDFSGKTLVPFCTSGGSALSDTVESIRAAESGAVVLDGFHNSGSNAADAEERVGRWLKAIHLSK